MILPRMILPSAAALAFEHLGFLDVFSEIRRLVAQVSKPAVSPISKSAARDLRCGQRAGKPAIQQTGKSALPAPTAWTTVPPTENVEESHLASCRLCPDAKPGLKAFSYPWNPRDPWCQSFWLRQLLDRQERDFDQKGTESTENMGRKISVSSATSCLKEPGFWNPWFMILPRMILPSSAPLAFEHLGFLDVFSEIRRLVAQVSKPAVSPISKSAARDLRCGQRAGKPAIQQTGKSALPAPTAWTTVPPTENVEESHLASCRLCPDAKPGLKAFSYPWNPRDPWCQSFWLRQLLDRQEMDFEQEGAESAENRVRKISVSSCDLLFKRAWFLESVVYDFAPHDFAFLRPSGL